MSVSFRSTRATAGTEPVDFKTALWRGLAPDGGLYEPVKIPRLPADWRQVTTFSELAARVLGNWLGDAGLGQAAFQKLVADAFNFPVPLRQLADDRWLLELHHGPTLAFKDFGARFMARVMDALLEKAGRRLTIVVATSGDTGSAVAAGFTGRANLDVVLLYPAGRVSRLQELQLTQKRPGVRTFSVAGDFDDCQRMAKAVLADKEVQARGVSSANSINIGRLLPQQLYYLWALRELGRPVRFVVPCGNLGNLTAGIYAALGGAETDGFIAAHNANDWFPAWLRGEEEAFAFRPTRQTLSNAMDVGAPSNFERLHALGARATGLITGFGVDEAATLQRMATTWNEDGVLVCPHTAVGLEALARERAGSGGGPAVVLATAHPGKFPEVVARALPGVTAGTKELQELEGAATEVTPLPADTAALREVLLAGYRT